jgi:MSHA pilin protein MshA
LDAAQPAQDSRDASRQLPLAWTGGHGGPPSGVTFAHPGASSISLHDRQPAQDLPDLPALCRLFQRITPAATPGRCDPRNKGFAVRARPKERLMNPGFTLIELLVVICIVAVTTSFALPKFWQLQRQARIGHLNAARGAVHAAATLIHARALTRNDSADTSACAGGAIADNRLDGPGTVCTEHGLVRTQHGYPATSAPGQAGAPGILGAAGIGTVFHASDAQLRAEGYVASVSGTVMTVARADAPQPAQCSFTYTESPGAQAAALVSPTVVSGC